MLLSAGTMTGNDVVNAEGEDLGSVEEIMIDIENGTVAYVVLASGGVLGMGEKLFAIPWDAMRLDTVEKRFVFNVPKERLQQAPGFDRNNWPETSSEVWRQEITNYWRQDIPQRRAS